MINANITIFDMFDAIGYSKIFCSDFGCIFKCNLNLTIEACELKFLASGENTICLGLIIQQFLQMSAYLIVLEKIEEC